MKHPIDRVGGLILRVGPPSLRFFSGGWGPSPSLPTSDILTTAPEPVSVRWISRSDDDGIPIRHGTFTSPWNGLPVRTSSGAIVSVGDLDATRVVLLMAAWNEHVPTVRIALARRLTELGITSLLPENPYFGSRRPDPDGGHPIDTVSAFLQMGAAAVTEARGILRSLESNGRELGVSGYSMGGNTAALVAATFPGRIAAAPLAASHSPGPVFLDGVLRAGVDWPALGGTEAAVDLRRALGSVSVLDYPPQEHLRSSVIVGARSDAYIPRSATESLAHHWNGSDLRWERGGHATLIWLHKERLVAAIGDAFDRTWNSPGV